MLRHQATGDLGVRGAGEYRLDSLALKAAPDAVHLKRGPRPRPFQGRVPWFAEHVVDADFRSVRRFVERNLADRLVILVGQWNDLIEETFHLDGAVWAPHGIENAHQRVDRVSDSPAV